jgi:integrase
VGKSNNDTFVRPSEVNKFPLKTGMPSRLDVRGLANHFLAEKRQLRGKKTFQDYKSRLDPLIEFAETPTNRKRWPYAGDIDRAFVVEFRRWLHERPVTRNGRSAGQPYFMSSGQVLNVMECSRTLLNWAKRTEVNRVPTWFANPFTHDLIGARPQRDPLAPSKLPIEKRIELVRIMDAWQLCVLALSFTMPSRPEELAGLMISDVDFDKHEFAFGTRLGGDDFNKAKMAFRVPFAEELTPLLLYMRGDRTDGPLLLRRTVFEGRRTAAVDAQTKEQIITAYQQALAKAKRHEVQTEQDRKKLFRKVLRNTGGVNTKDMNREFNALVGELEPGNHIRYYDTRGAVTTDLKNAGVDIIIRRYVTAHSLEGEILGHYEHQDLHLHMRKHFAYIQPLLDAIADRTDELGIGT